MSRKAPRIYVAACAACHGVPGVDKGGNIRNLGYVAPETIANLKDIVFKGPFRDQRHARLHRQAEGRGYPEAAGLHPGHRGRDPAEVTTQSSVEATGAQATGCREIAHLDSRDPHAIAHRRRPVHRRRESQQNRKGCAIVSRSPYVVSPCRWERALPQNIRPSLTSTQRPFLICWTWVIVLARWSVLENLVGGELKMSRNLSPDSSASIIFWPVRSLPALLA